MADLSPMMKQYFQIKDSNKDSILFFRLGDFYEMFFEDAKIASKELELTLTGRDCGQEERAPMCGVPYHSCEAYIARLVAKGYKVAICEQTEDPATTKGLVKRDVVRVITPGTLIESSMLDESCNNYISCVYVEKGECGLCFCDISTGQIFATQINGKDLEQRLKNELGRFSPRELLLGGEALKVFGLSDFIRTKLNTGVEMLEDSKFDFESGKNQLISQYNVSSLSEIGMDGIEQTVISLSALMGYLKETQKTGLERLSLPEIYNEKIYLSLDYNTKRNLELESTMRSNDRKGTLLWVIDKTRTSMGKRLIRSWLEKPLMSCASIINRQNAISELVDNYTLLSNLREALTGIIDIERTVTRVVYGTGGCKELRAIASAAEKLPKLREILSGTNSRMLKEIYKNIDELQDIFELIDSHIVEDPPFSVREGGMIKDGVNADLDELRGIMRNSTDLLTRMTELEKEKTGIPKLKIAYNRVFGYYIEIPNSYKNMVPQSYIRKQTLTNCERYITEELKDTESKILGAKEKAVVIEHSIFEDIRKKVSDQLRRIEKTAENIARIDTLASLAQVAVDNRYCCPIVNTSGIINVKNGRHPVVELLLRDAPFVPNDILLDCHDNRASIITGPNMAGKSTYMRQTALIVILAQMGSFVPAEYAEIGVVDAVFTRVGASDDLASGQSTFMVEMNEVATIIKSATDKSLLIFDEIGRGTSTYDGMSIARAVLEYVADKKKLGAKTMFATHYHELTVMEDVLDGIKNYSIAVKKRGDDITFLRRIIPGGADRSYGIEVAKLAGVPNSVINRAKEILSEIENGNTQPAPVKTRSEYSDFPLLTDNYSPVIDKLKSIDINTLTPIESMNILFSLVKEVQD